MLITIKCFFYLMLKILNYISLIRDGGCFSFEIADDLLPWNNGTFVIDFEKGHCTLTDKKPQHHLSMSIGTFTTLLLGYKSAEKLLQMGKIQATYDAVAKLDDILYHEIPYVSDYI